MKPSYIDMLNAFQEKSIGELGPTEQIVYLRLLMIWNGLCRPVGTFDVSNAQLKRETGIKDRKTLAKAKKILVEKGYIKTVNFTTHMVKFKMIDLTTMSKNDIATRGNIPPATRGNFPQAEPTRGKNDQVLGEFFPPSQRFRESISTTTTEHKEAPCSKAVEKYEDGIHPLSSQIEADKLMSDVEQYGEDRVVKAIERAVLRNKRSLAYIEAILRSWEANGYDEPEVRKGRRKYRGNSGHTEKHEKSIYAKWADGEL